MAPNHGGDPLGSIFGPMGSHWIKKMDQNRKKTTMRQNSNSRLPCGHQFFAKNGSYRQGAKSRWGPPRVHLWGNGVPLGQKNGYKPLKMTMPQKSNFWLPRGHQFFAKNGSYGYGTKSWWGLPRVHHGSNGVQLGPKNGSKPQKITMLQNSNFRLPRGYQFFAKYRSYIYGTKSWWGHSKVHLGANRVPLGPRTGSKPLKITMPQNSNFWLQPAVIDFSLKMEVAVMAPNHGGDPLGSILGPMGSHWVQKMGQNRANLPCPKSNFLPPRGHRFKKK